MLRAISRDISLRFHVTRTTGYNASLSPTWVPLVMSSRKTFLISMLASVLTSVPAMMSFVTFNEKIAWACFNDTHDESEAVYARSMPQLIDFIRRVEESHWDVDAADVAVLLLRRFSIDFVDHQRLSNGERFLVNSARERKAAVFNALLHPAPPLEIDEASLSLPQKCSLFAMLSHAMNSVPRLRGQSVSRTTQEQGVVSLGADTSVAISMGHVLRGVVASKYSSRDSALGLLRKVKPYVDMAEGHLVVDHVYGPTLAGTLGTVSTWETSKAPTLGSNGSWVSTLCQRAFVLAGDPGKVTDAELIGALDGFIMAMTVNRMIKDRRLLLSRILDMYYSRRGIHELLPEFHNGLSFCSRKEAVKRLLSAERLQEQVLVMARLYAKLNGVDTTPVTIKSAILPMLKNFHAKLEGLLKPPLWCAAESKAVLPTFATRGDVLILMDPTPGNSIYENSQRALAGFIAEDYLRRNPGNRVSISAAQMSEDARQLVLLYSSQTSKYASPACAIETTRGCTECTEVDIWRAVNGTWSALQSGLTAEQVTPAKVIVYMKYSAFRSSTEDVGVIIQEMRKRHDDLTIFAVGPRADIMQNFQHHQDAVVIIPNFADEGILAQIAGELSQEISRVPASIRCYGCERDNQDTSGTLTEFQTPLTASQWVMYPRYFKEVPQQINVTFETQHLPIRICMERQNCSLLPKARDDICRESGANAKAIQFSLRNVCVSTEPDSCESLYFSLMVLPRRPGENFVECTDPRCRYPDQSQVVITYEVMFSGNSTTNLRDIEERTNPSLNLEDTAVFRELVGSKCFRQPKEMGEDDFSVPMAPSLDIFLDLVRRVEDGYKGRDLIVVAKMLLNRFSLDEFEATEVFKQREVMKEKRTLLRALSFSSRDVEEKFDEALLTTREKCALFFMLSHSLQGGSVNSTTRLETGVVRLDWETNTLAVSISKVLQGIVAAKTARVVNISELFRDAWPQRDISELNPELVLDTDFAVTLGSLLGMAAVEASLGRQEGSVIGVEGHWADPGCPSFYSVRAEQGLCTYALLRGAIDGYILGKYGHVLANSGVPLSDALAWYYGRSGVPHSISGTSHLSVCNRRELLRPLLKHGYFEKQVETFARAYGFLLKHRNVARIQFFAAKTVSHLMHRMRMDLLRNPRFCDAYPPTPETATCSTPTDVHVVMDADASRNDSWVEQQRQFIRHLAHYLELNDKRSLHLYVNKKDMEGEIQFQLRNLTTPSTVSCFVNSLRLAEIATDDEVSTLESLERRLVRETMWRENSTIKPSQAVVYLKYGNLRAPIQKLRPVTSRMQQSHWDVNSVFTVGDDRSVLRSMATQGILDDGSLPERTVILSHEPGAVKRAAKTIARVICAVPASLHCQQCSTSETVDFDIAENSVSHFVLRPQDFPHLTNTQITIRPKNGAMWFCRKTAGLSGYRLKNCEPVSDSGKKYHAACYDGICQPLHFAVIGAAETCEAGAACRPKGTVQYRMEYKTGTNLSASSED
ncbi:uncharacterized protein LOC135367387 [Ornithodoros turicata]|uniref:uncharacterized protein LOC135367387 n=1 Tax=Ornithodoros turicata TaxID=34597 RepID=UPI003138F0D1